MSAPNRSFTDPGSLDRVLQEMTELPLRTFGPFPRPNFEHAAGAEMHLEEALTAARWQVNGLPPARDHGEAGMQSLVDDLPLSVVIYGWGDAKMRSLLRELYDETRPLLLESDPIWLVGDDSLAAEQGVVLSATDRDDASLLHNLVTDILFLTGEEDRDVIVDWHGRARMVIIDRRGSDLLVPNDIVVYERFENGELRRAQGD